MLPASHRNHPAVPQVQPTCERTWEAPALLVRRVGVPPEGEVGRGEVHLQQAGVQQIQCQIQRDKHTLLCHPAAVSTIKPSVHTHQQTAYRTWHVAPKKPAHWRCCSRAQGIGRGVRGATYCAAQDRNPHLTHRLVLPAQDRPRSAAHFVAPPARTCRHATRGVFRGYKRGGGMHRQAVVSGALRCMNQRCFHCPLRQFGENVDQLRWARPSNRRFSAAPAAPSTPTWKVRVAGAIGCHLVLGP